MQLVWVIGVIFVCATNVKAQQFIERNGGESACRIRTEANVMCVSKTEFVLAFQNPFKDPPRKCPPGTHCAEGPQPCSAVEDPACFNEVAGAYGVCNSCPLDVNYNPVCVSPTEYAFCVNGRVQQAMKYKCSAPTAFCKAEFDAQMQLVSICTNGNKTTDCPIVAGAKSSVIPSALDISINLTIPSNESQIVVDILPRTDSICQSAGLVANPSDGTCQSYINCHTNETGGFNQAQFNCTEVGSVFDPSVQQCVPAGSYICPQQLAIS